MLGIERHNDENRIFAFSYFNSCYIIGLFATASDANAAIYVKIPGLQGDVTTKGYEGYFAADSFSFGVEREMKESGEKGGTADINIGVGELQECTISKSLDSASAKLAQFAVNGNSLGTVEIEFAKTGEDNGEPTTYLKYKLDRAFVKNWSTSGDADDRPTEEVAFYYNDITVIREGGDKESSEKSTESGISEEHPKTNDKTTTDETIPIPQPRVPNWVQSTATFWADGDVTDKEFTDGIGFLVKEGIIELDEESIHSETNREEIDSAEKYPEVPAWVKQNTKWWTTAEISEEQFLESIKWLIKNNIIKGISNQ
ncbi:MAG: type VI secretion system tube protein Hcp [Nitrosopumilus sp.]